MSPGEPDEIDRLSEAYDPQREADNKYYVHTELVGGLWQFLFLDLNHTLQGSCFAHFLWQCLLLRRLNTWTVLNLPIEYGRFR